MESLILSLSHVSYLTCLLQTPSTASLWVVQGHVIYEWIVRVRHANASALSSLLATHAPAHKISAPCRSDDARGAAVRRIKCSQPSAPAHAKQWQHGVHAGVHGQSHSVFQMYLLFSFFQLQRNSSAGRLREQIVSKIATEPSQSPSPPSTPPCVFPPVCYLRHTRVY